MEENELLFDKIEAYLQKKLPDGEARAFEQDMAADPGLQDLVAMHRFEREGIRLLVDDDLRQKIQDWSAEPPPPANPGGWGGLRGSKWAAGVGLAAAIVVAAWFIFWKPDLPVQPADPTPAGQQQPPTLPSNAPVAEQPDTKTMPSSSPANLPTDLRYERLALNTEVSSNQETDRLRNADKTGNKTADTTRLGRAEQLFEAAKYPEAANLLRQIGRTEEQYPEAQLLLGRACVRQKQFAAAADIFQKLLARQQPAIVREPAEWHLLLSLLPEYRDHQKQADDLLRKMLNDPEHGYRTAAQNLKAQLDQLRKEGH